MSCQRGVAAVLVVLLGLSLGAAGEVRAAQPEREHGPGYYLAGAIVRLALARGLFQDGAKGLMAERLVSDALARDRVDRVADRSPILAAVGGRPGTSPDPTPAQVPLFMPVSLALAQTFKDTPDLRKLVNTRALGRLGRWLFLVNGVGAALPVGRVQEALRRVARDNARANDLLQHPRVVELLRSHETAMLGHRALLACSTAARQSERLPRATLEEVLRAAGAASAASRDLLELLYRQRWGEAAPTVTLPPSLEGRLTGDPEVEDMFWGEACRAEELGSGAPLWPWSLVADTQVWLASMGRLDPYLAPQRRCILPWLDQFRFPEIDVRAAHPSLKEFAEHVVHPELVVPQTFPLPEGVLAVARLEATKRLLRDLNVGRGHKNGSGNKGEEDVAIVAEAAVAERFGRDTLILTQDRGITVPLIQRTKGWGERGPGRPLHELFPGGCTVELTDEQRIHVIPAPLPKKGGTASGAAVRPWLQPGTIPARWAADWFLDWARRNGDHEMADGAAEQLVARFGLVQEALLATAHDLGLSCQPDLSNLLRVERQPAPPVAEQPQGLGL